MHKKTLVIGAMLLVMTAFVSGLIVEKQKVDVAEMMPVQWKLLLERACNYYGGAFAMNSEIVICADVNPVIPCSNDLLRQAAQACRNHGGIPMCFEHTALCALD